MDIAWWSLNDPSSVEALEDVSVLAIDGARGRKGWFPTSSLRLHGCLGHRASR
jgi:hypothetical protein